MAKAVVKKEEESALIVPDYGEQLANAGWDNVDGGDFKIPFLNQLQALSPQCTDGDERQIPGAKPGMFFNSVTGQLYPGPVRMIVVLTQKSWVEWKPQDQGGGFVAEHGLQDPVVEKAKSQTKDMRDLKTPAGNDLVYTKKMYALLLNESDEVIDQVVISFTRTKIKRYDAIMTLLRTHSKNIPLFAHRLSMSETSEKNSSGKPYKNVNLTPAIKGSNPREGVIKSLLPQGSPLINLANELREAILGGAAKADHDSVQDSGVSATDEEADSVFGEGSSRKV